MSYLDQKDDNDVYDDNFASIPPMKHVIELGVRRPFTEEEIKRLKRWLQEYDESEEKDSIVIKYKEPLKYFISYESTHHPYSQLWGPNDTLPRSEGLNIRWITGYRYNNESSHKQILYPNQNLIDLSKGKKRVRDLFSSYNPILLAYCGQRHLDKLFKSVGFLETIASLFIFNPRIMEKIDKERPYYLESYKYLSTEEWTQWLVKEKNNEGFQLFEIDEFRNSRTGVIDIIERIYDEPNNEEKGAATFFSVEDTSVRQQYKIYLRIDYSKIRNTLDDPKMPLKMYAFIVGHG